MSKSNLLHLIKTNRMFRKHNEKKISKSITHPALLPGWDELSRDQQSEKLFKWKILIKSQSVTY